MYSRRQDIMERNMYLLIYNKCISEMKLSLLNRHLELIPNTGQCTVQNLATTQVTSTELSIHWECYDREWDDEFQVRYRVANRGQCEEAGGSQDPPFDTKATLWGEWNRQGVSNTRQHSATLANLSPYSTYTVSVQSRAPSGVGTYIYHSTKYNLDPNPTTLQAG